MSNLPRHIIATVLTLFMSLQALCAPTGHGPMNRPYADLRRAHLGFYAGLHFQDMTFANTGATAYDGTEWYADQPSFSPGFCVGASGDLRLNRWFNLRFTPGLYFGSRGIVMREISTGETCRQTLKSTFLVLPVDLKFSGQRYRNSRPYIAGGLMPAFDVARKSADTLMLRTADVYLTAAIGCDFYLPYFKLIPEVKFCFGLCDMLRHDRPDFDDDPATMRFTNAIKRATSSMVVLTFYFE